MVRRRLAPARTMQAPARATHSSRRRFAAPPDDIRQTSSGAKMKICSSALHRAAPSGKNGTIVAGAALLGSPARGESNAEDIDYRFDRAARHRGVCADRHEVSGVLGSRPRTEDAEGQDVERTGRVGICDGTLEEIGEGHWLIGKLSDT